MRAAPRCCWLYSEPIAGASSVRLSLHSQLERGAYGIRLLLDQMDSFDEM